MSLKRQILRGKLRKSVGSNGIAGEWKDFQIARLGEKAYKAMRIQNTKPSKRKLLKEVTF